MAVLKMENRRIKIAGNRVKLQGEVLHGIRVVKFYGAYSLCWWLCLRTLGTLPAACAPTSPSSGL